MGLIFVELYHVLLLFIFIVLVMFCNLWVIELLFSHTLCMFHLHFPCLAKTLVKEWLQIMEYRCFCCSLDV
jgi:hypothetical protein